MRYQRRMLEENLREGVRNDDITNSLAKRGDKDTDKVFKEEMKKHEKTVDYIRQNILAQRNVVSALTEKNAEYADARDLSRRKRRFRPILLALAKPRNTTAAESTHPHVCEKCTKKNKK